MSEMRRKDREMDMNFAYSILDKAEFGSLATLNEDGSPYCIPVSTVRQEDKIYIHGASQSTKIENIKRNPKICMSFVGDVKALPPSPREEFDKDRQDPAAFGRIASKKFATEYELAVVFGTAHIIEGREEKILGLKLLSEKYTPGNMPYFNAAIEDSLKKTCVLRIDIEKITGKRNQFDKDGVEMKRGRVE